MKKFIVFTALLLITVFSLTSCLVPTDEVLMSLDSYKSKEFYTSGGFQDYTDYGKYYYKDKNLEGNRYFTPMTDDLKADFEEHLVSFEGWVELEAENDPQNELVVNYDFDRSIVTDDDYIYIYDDPDYDRLGNYDVYLYDSDTDVLYFFHNNI